MNILLYKVRKHLRNEQNIKQKLFRISLVFILMSIGISVLLFFAILDLFLGNNIKCLGEFFLLIIYSLVLLLNYNGKFSIANYLMIFSTIIILIFNGSLSASGYGNYFMWFPITCGIFLLFEKTKEIIFLLIILFLAAVFVYSTDNSFLKSQDYEFSSYDNLDFPICFILSLFLVLLYIYYILKFKNKNERRLNFLISKFHNSNEDLTKANQELDSFVYKASHDLRSPLTSVMGLITLLRIENDQSRIHEYTDLLEKSVNKLDGYITDILDISKNSRIGISTDLVDFEPLVKDIFDQYGFAENNSKINLKVIVSSSSPFYTDEKRIQMIFRNLISNAIRYADFEKEQSEITVKIVSNSKMASISIKDNGIGIKEEYKKKVFDMFFRGTDKKNGSGLGLYIVKESILKLNGNIKLNSEEGKWTEFVILIPNLLYKKVLESQNIGSV